MIIFNHKNMHVFTKGYQKRVSYNTVQYSMLFHAVQQGGKIPSRGREPSASLVQETSYVPSEINMKTP